LQRFFSRPSRDLLDRGGGVLHGGVVARACACGLDFRRRVVTVGSSEALADLNAVAMAVHIAKAANIHENVKPERLPGAERPEDFVVWTAAAEAEVDNLAPPFFGRSMAIPAHV